MRKLIYALGFLVAFSLTAQPLDYKNVSSDLLDNGLVFEFNTKDYLPRNFDAYKGMFIDESYLLSDKTIMLDFNTWDYLPKGFDAYRGMFLEDNLSIEEAPFDFNIKDYLPIDFSPYASFENINEEQVLLIKFIKEL